MLSCLDDEEIAIYAFKSKVPNRKSWESSHRDNSRQAVLTAGEAGASILYHTSSPVRKMSQSLKKVLYQKAIHGSCLDD